MVAGSQIRRFLILHKELDADDGELTRTQKVRRSMSASTCGSQTPFSPSPYEPW
jgi:long-chain acyl-CoA synthetase